MIDLSPEAITNVWRHWFAGHIASIGGTSRARLDPIDPGLFKRGPPPRVEPVEPPGATPIATRPNRAMRRSEGHQVRRTRSVRLPPATGQPVPQTPLSPWAQALLGDPRNSDITLDDLVDGLDHYFEVFGRVRRLNQTAYNYFARIGAPIIVRNTKIWHSWAEYPTIPNAARLPNMIGAFLTASREEYRDGAIKETPSLLDFHIFERLSRGYATSAPPGTIIFRHNVAVLGRKVWTREEEKKYPWGADTYGGCWLLGVLPDGEVRALPMHWRHYQRDIGVHHSMFKIPEVLKELHKTHDPHKAVLGFFNAILAFTASALAGVQVTIKRGGLALRIGLPIAHVRRFFADRDPSVHNERRRAILHLARPH